MNDRRVHRDGRTLTEEEIYKNVLETLHEGRAHDQHVKKNDQETAAEVDEMKTEGGIKIKSHLALFAPEKILRALYQPGRRIF
jgi:hypothetical protein